jgi:hypothetical protein
MALRATSVAEYLAKYTQQYRDEYARLTGSPPAGAGYPALDISPYLQSRRIECIVSPDGALVYAEGEPPDYEWWVAGGPAMMVDYEPSRTPQAVVDLLKREGIWGKPIGIYRLVSKAVLPDVVWNGRIEPIQEEASARLAATEIRVHRTDLARMEVVKRMTYGAFVEILDVRLPGPDAPFWTKSLFVRRMGFMTADRVNRRFFAYMEVLHHGDPAAWDPRAIPTRVQVDVRRDFGVTFGTVAEKASGGSMSFGGNAWVQPFFDRLTVLKKTLDQFAGLLEEKGDEAEGVFHAFLEANPILLDVYAEPVSKPRWKYPPGESPLGKTHVEPDFVLKYADGSYRLVELERPAKMLATAQGQPRAEVNQAAFQIAEWRAYIANHYNLLRASFPGIGVRNGGMIVISRSSAASFGAGRDPRKYKELLGSQYPGIEIYTYDELLERARQAYTRLASLAVVAS